MPIGGSMITQCRCILMMMCFACFFILSCQRINSSFALLYMVKWEPIRNNSDEHCPADDNIITSSQVGEFHWSIPLQCQVLNSYFYGLVVLQLPAEFLVNRVSAQYVALSGMVIASACSFLTPKAAKWNVMGIICVQIAKAMGHALVMPAVSVMMGRWIPTKQLTRFATYVTCGIPTGAFVMLIGGSILYNKSAPSWSNLYFFPGVIGTVWCFLWLYLCCDLRFMPILTSNRRQAAVDFPQRAYSVPTWAILTSKPFWGYVCAGSATYWMIAFNIFIMPLCFHIYYRIEIQWNGLLSSFANVMQAFVYLLSFTVTDRILQRRLASQDGVRRVSTCIGLTIFATCMVLLTFSGCNKAVGVLLVVVAIGGSGINIASLTLIPTDMSPNFSGVLSGIMNTVGALTGSVLPFMVGFLTDKGSDVKGWDKVFYASAFISFISMILYMAFSSNEIQDWNTPRSLTAIRLSSATVMNFRTRRGDTPQVL